MSGNPWVGLEIPKRPGDPWLLGGAERFYFKTRTALRDWIAEKPYWRRADDGGR